ncbi:MAG: hypothetical protein AAFY41_09505 [Bacteroidota bacterium]
MSPKKDRGAKREAKAQEKINQEIGGQSTRRSGQRYGYRQKPVQQRTEESNILDDSDDSCTTSEPITPNEQVDSVENS